MVQTSQSVAPKRKSTAAGLSTGGRAVKRRASKACQCCRSRKVRCDVVESGIPCTNCRLDEVECCVTEGKRRKKSVVETELLHKSPVESELEDRDDPPHFPLFDDIDGLQELSMPEKHVHSSPPTFAAQEHELSQHRPHMLYQAQGHRLTPEERTRRLSILKSRGIAVQDPAALTSPFFPPFKLQNDVVLPKYVTAIPDRIVAEDIDYLQRKGAFLIPEIALRNELLRCYVQYVHPYTPLLELEDFLSAIQKNDGSSLISLLLFQAVMFAATAYIDMRYLTAQGYESRKAARKAFFQRIKLLYDFDFEIDRVTVVQSVLLMTYWYESPDDPKDVWHWLGVAISLARTIGLNCNTSSSPLSRQKQKLWKRVWWCCYTRDRLVAIGMRRPIRIREDDFDVPMLEVSDFETQSLGPELTRMIGGCSAVRDGSKREILAKMYIAVVRCCQCITKVLSVQYSILGHRLGATQETTMRLVPRRSAADPVEVIRCDRELEMWYESLPSELRYFKNTKPREQNVQNDGEVLNLHRALLTGIYLTTTSALHRPQMMPATPNLVISPELKELSKDRVREAASAITDVFRDLYARDSIRYLPNTGVTILLPAIIVHLLDIKSPDSATRQLSVRRFQFCMQVLQQLRDMYASADFAFSFLDAAIRKADVQVHSDSPSPTEPKDGQASMPSHGSKKKNDRQQPTTLTPPPEGTSSRSQRSSSQSSISSQGSGFINPRATSLSDPDSRHDPFAALTPPGSDKILHFPEISMSTGAAVALSDFNNVHDGGFHNFHQDIDMIDSSGGYIDANRLLDEEHALEHLIDEEAMKNDFDQLINLEGGAVAVDQLFSDSLAEANHGNDNMDHGLNFWNGLDLPIMAEEATHDFSQAMGKGIDTGDSFPSGLKETVFGVMPSELRGGLEARETIKNEDTTKVKN